MKYHSKAWRNQHSMLLSERLLPKACGIELLLVVVILTRWLDHTPEALANQVAKILPIKPKTKSMARASPSRFL